MLQGEVSRAGKSMWRLVINSTVGVGGFFDPASKIGVPGHGEDFGQTLAVWGANEGPYLMLPFLGPSNPRDTTGLVVDAAMDPTNQIPLKQHIWWSAGREYFTLLDLRAQTYQTVQGIQRSSVDYYSSLRSLYRQLRNEQIRNGRKRLWTFQIFDFQAFSCLELAIATREHPPNRNFPMRLPISPTRRALLLALLSVPF
jgi:phospholipid-binding lipoprotein MlaA